LKTQVEAKYPGSSSFAVGGFIFLRLFNPAVVTPDAIKIAICKSVGNYVVALYSTD
jgi:hypothetical protein